MSGDPSTLAIFALSCILLLLLYFYERLRQENKSLAKSLMWADCRINGLERRFGVVDEDDEIEDGEEWKRR